MVKLSVGVFGATSMVGQSLLPLLVGIGCHVSAFSRQTKTNAQFMDDANIVWRQLEKGEPDYESSHEKNGNITHWICLAPIWVLPDHFSMLAANHAKRVVALSSTSIFTKQNSSDQIEQETAAKLRNGEQRLIAWAEANQIEWVILRPTLIYGFGQDRNICEIARFISRFGFFPLLGTAQGLRQPVHIEDVATACVASLQSIGAVNHAYNISGSEKLNYREMVARVFKMMDKPERFVSIPIFAFRSAIACLKILPRFRNLSVAMAERMNADLIFDHSDAVRDFNFSPRPFRPEKTDLPF